MMASDLAMVRLAESNDLLEMIYQSEDCPCDPCEPFSWSLLEVGEMSELEVLSL